VLYDNYIGVGKNKSWKTERWLELETFWKLMNKLFDVAHADCERMIIIQQDKDFYRTRWKRGK